MYSLIDDINLFLYLLVLLDQQQWLDQFQVLMINYCSILMYSNDFFSIASRRLECLTIISFARFGNGWICCWCPIFWMGFGEVYSCFLGGLVNFLRLGRQIIELFSLFSCWFLIFKGLFRHFRPRKIHHHHFHCVYHLDHSYLQNLSIHLWVCN